ncbi:hypothetical protein [Moraxella lacunata]
MTETDPSTSSDTMIPHLSQWFFKYLVSSILQTNLKILVAQRMFGF